MNFGEKLQKIRKDKGLSQEQLAGLLNVSRQAVSKWESGQTYPELDKLITLSDLFNISLDELVKNKNIEVSYNNEEKNNGKEAVSGENEDIEVEEKEDEDDEEEDKDGNIIFGCFMIGTAIGLFTENFMLGTVGAFMGFGLTYILKAIKK
ncbi:MAG: helix-turn-helix transcriptional regulator [Clostridium sp.]